MILNIFFLELIKIYSNLIWILGLKSFDTTKDEISDINNPDLFKEVHFETYKQLKKAANIKESNLSKVEIYEKLMKPFKHSKKRIPDSKPGKFKTIYICGYGTCNREYTKVWNLLDHVRMHEGIRPYQCKL